MNELTFKGVLPWERTRVYDHLIDPRTWPTFIPGFESIDDVEGWGEVGGTCSGVISIGGVRKTARFELLDVEPGRMFRYRSVQEGLPDAIHTRTISDAPSGSVLDGHIASEPRPGVKGILDRTVVRMVVKRKMDKAMATLAAQMATGQATRPADG